MTLEPTAIFKHTSTSMEWDMTTGTSTIWNIDMAQGAVPDMSIGMSMDKDKDKGLVIHTVLTTATDTRITRGINTTWASTCKTRMFLSSTHIQI
mmetsp:Transcript_10553/g.18680  ORF Transcript_10553/g.18680 Transcript_10553/m.18680 type:complete len:94 (+) Transcript_10553:383-664(+)